MSCSCEALEVRLVEIIPTDARGIVVHLGDVNQESSDSIIEMRSDLEKALGIPVVVVSGDVRFEAIT